MYFLTAEEARNRISKGRNKRIKIEQRLVLDEIKKSIALHRNKCFYESIISPETKNFLISKGYLVEIDKRLYRTQISW